MVWIAEAEVFLDRQCAKNLLKSEKTSSEICFILVTL